MNQDRFAAPTNQRPNLEALAAYLDGTLDAGGRAAVERTLATSEEAREILAEAMRLIDDLEDSAVGGAVAAAPATVRPGPRWRVWIPLAAAAAAVVVAVPLVLEGPSGVAAVASASLPTGAIAATPGWERQAWSTPRGTASPPIARGSFRAGVRWTDLSVALSAGRLEVARDLAAEIVALLRPVGLSSAAAARVEALSDGEWTLADLERAEASLAVALDGDHFSLGAWVEAARLAGLVGRDDFLSEPAVARAFDRLAALPWPPRVAAELGKLAPDVPPGAATVEASAEALIVMMGG